MPKDDQAFERTNYLATLSVIIGAGALMAHAMFFWCSVFTGAVVALPSVIGLGAGYVGLRQARNHRGDGREAAIVGMVLNCMSLLASFFWVGLFAVFSALAALASLAGL